jgi:FixJ family two-component response regulator
LLVKPFHADALPSAVKEALQRSRAALELNLVCALQNHHVSLSCREHEVMHWLVLSALPNKQVSFELGIAR